MSLIKIPTTRHWYCQSAIKEDEEDHGTNPLKVGCFALYHLWKRNRVKIIQLEILEPIPRGFSSDTQAPDQRTVPIPHGILPVALNLWATCRDSVASKVRANDWTGMVISTWPSSVGPYNTGNPVISAQTLPRVGPRGELIEAESSSVVKEQHFIHNNTYLGNG